MLEEKLQNYSEQIDVAIEKTNLVISDTNRLLKNSEIV